MTSHHSETADQIYTQGLSKMSYAEKWEVVGQLRETAWRLKAARIQTQHPEWNESQVQAAVRKIFLYATT